MNKQVYTMLVGTVVSAGVVGLAAGAGLTWAADPAAQASGTTNPVVLHIGASCIGNQIPMMLRQLTEASMPPIKLTQRCYLRGATGLANHWQRPPQPMKGGDLLSWIRYPDLPRPKINLRDLAKWGGERRADFAVLDAYGELNDEEELLFWMRLYRQALVKRGLKPVVYTCHFVGPQWVNFMFPFKTEAEGLAKLAKANTACVNAAVELDLEVAPGHLACYRAKRARPDLALEMVGSTDKGHAGQKGYYLEACTLYAALFNRSPEGLPVRTIYMKPPDPNLNETVGVGQVELTEDEMLFMQRTAWEAVQEFRRMVAERKADLAAGKSQPLAVKPRVLYLGAPHNDTFFDKDAGRPVLGFRSALRDRVKGQTGLKLVYDPLGPGSISDALVELDDWLGGQKWALIAFGCGAWELVHHTPPAEYERDLRALVAKLKQNGSPLFWTGFLPAKQQRETPLQISDMGLVMLTNVTVAADAKPLAAVAEKVMRENGVALDAACAQDLAACFAPEGQVPAERMITKKDWVKLAGILADSLARQVKTP